jgi:hypothetical protein
MYDRVGMWARCCNVAWHVIWNPKYIWKEWIEFCEILGIRPLLICKLPELHYTVQ